MRCLAVILPLLLCACATAPSCPPGMGPATVAELAFGRNVGGVPRVSEADWAAFLAEEVTPRFPDGLTVFDAMGQWRARDGQVRREATKVLWLVLPEATAEAAARVAPLAEAYRTRFGQESVMRVVRPGCVGF